MDIGIISLFLIPIVLFILMERLFSNESVILRIDSAFLYLNAFIWVLVLLFLFFTFNDLRVAIVIQTVFMLVFGLLDHYLMAFRGSPFQPWDIYSVSTAISVSDNYSYAMNRGDIFLCVGFLIVLIWGITLKLKIQRTQKHYFLIRVASIIATGLSIITLTMVIQNNGLMSKINMFNKLFVQDEMVERNGMAVTLLYDLQFLKVDKPKGYSADKAKALLDEASNNYKSLSASDKKPNIIVIVSESFSDLSILGDFKTNKDVIPFIKAMLEGKDNVVSGYLSVPVLGGNTANTEFEFLTGNAMKGFDMSSVPYQQYINAPMESIASNLKNRGYNTIAIHPYGRKGWNRDKVYQYFGFDEFISEEGFIDPIRIRDYISDQSDYEKIIEVIEKCSKEAPLFVFTVTMQNHGAYFIEYDNFTPDIKADGIDDIEFNQYLSLIHISDKETQKLIDYFSSYDEPTIVVFFGDHQPNDTTVDELYKDAGLNVFDLDDAEREKRFLVPFFIWANYDIQEETGVMTTPYGLGIRTMELSGVELSNYEKFVSEVINGKYTEDDYRLVQYYKVFDEEN